MHETYRLWAANIRAGRQALGLKQYELADLVGVRPASVCRWEDGQNPTPPNDTHKVKLATVLHQDVARLFPLTRAAA